MPSFSVIIPAYNAADTLLRAIDSALAQTLPPSEVIVIDDGSTDQTAEVAATRRVRLIRQENRGLAGARNSGIRAADSDWIALLDADDEWMPTRLARISDTIDATPDVDIVTTDAVVREVDGTEGHYYNDREFCHVDQSVAILKRNFIFGGAAIRRDPLVAAGMFDETIPKAGEWPTWLRLILSGSHAALVDEPLAIYIKQPDSLSTDTSNDAVRRAAGLRAVRDEFALEGRERAALDSTLSRYEAIVAAQRAFRALSAREKGFRKLCLLAAAAPSAKPLTRLKFFAAALMPRRPGTG